MPDVLYIEILTFRLHDRNKYIQYEQKTWHVESGEQSHWQVGFIRLLEDQSVQMTNSQDSGRLEKALGTFELVPNGLILKFESTYLGNDSRMVSAQREFIIENDRLRYYFWMSTQTTTDLTSHLQAVLEKQES